MFPSTWVVRSCTTEGSVDEYLPSCRRSRHTNLGMGWLIANRPHEAIGKEASRVLADCVEVCLRDVLLDRKTGPEDKVDVSIHHPCCPG